MDASKTGEATPLMHKRGSSDTTNTRSNDRAPTPSLHNCDTGCGADPAKFENNDDEVFNTCGSKASGLSSPYIFIHTRHAGSLVR